MIADSLTKQGVTYTNSKNSTRSHAAVHRKPGRPPKLHPPGTINGIIAECAVCRDKATGLHYAVMTCEGCKGFFKRSIQTEKKYKCRSRTDCIINKESRNACQACRMKRCFEVGMKENLVRDDRTPGNRKKKYSESLLMGTHRFSDNSNQVAAYVKQEPGISLKPDGSCIEQMMDCYPLSNKKKYEHYNSDYGGNISAFHFGDMALSATGSLDHDILYNNMLPLKHFDSCEMPRMAAEIIGDAHSFGVIDHISSIGNVDHLIPISINCSGDQELPLTKCRHSPRCLMHLLTRLMKAKPVEAAICKYYDRYPSSELFLDCLANEIHLIIKFAKKTPGFCDLSMGRKLTVVQKHALSILFIRIIYRSLTCPINHVQFASNICLSFNDFDKIDILSDKFCQTIIELISSFKSLNLDIYELSLIQYAIIEDEDETWNPDTKFYPILDGFERPTSNLSQRYLKLYTTNKYPDQPHRWIFIMLSLTQVQEMVKLFIAQCLHLVNAQRMIISNDIFKEILSI